MHSLAEEGHREIYGRYAEIVEEIPLSRHPHIIGDKIFADEDMEDDFLDTREQIFAEMDASKLPDLTSEQLQFLQVVAFSRANFLLPVYDGLADTQPVGLDSAIEEAIVHMSKEKEENSEGLETEPSQTNEEGIIDKAIDYAATGVGVAYLAGYAGFSVAKWGFNKLPIAGVINAIKA